MEKYQKAIQIYEQVAASALDHSLIKYSAREYYFRATLCHLCIDPINAQNAITRYEAEFPAFDVGREAKFLKVTMILTKLTMTTYLILRLHSRL